MKLTLRARIITLITLFTIILIAAFTGLLLNRQLQVITENNHYRARIGSFVAKRDFERALHLSSQTGDPEKAFEKLIPILQKGQLTETASVTDLKGKVVASHNNFLVYTQLRGEESAQVKQAIQKYSPKTWFHSEVSAKQITFFIPITLDSTPRYVAILGYSLGNMGQAIEQVGFLCLITAIGVIGAVVPLCLVLIRAILGPIKLLGTAADDIAGGNLGRKVEVPTQDELGQLAGTFNEMTTALVNMKARAENANPLTKLPGNNMIHEEIENRLKSGKKFVAVYSDLDNFKAFNDKYGIGAGDKAIQLTAKVAREALKKGAPDDFLGHEGGDDFFILTTPEKAQAVTDYFGQEFDKQVRSFYSEEDQKLGKIVSRDREGNVKEFPIMTISLAGVSNAVRKLETYAEITNICAEVKKKAKNLSKERGKSSFYLDQRTGERGGANERKPGAAQPAPAKTAAAPAEPNLQVKPEPTPQPDPAPTQAVSKPPAKPPAPAPKPTPYAKPGPELKPKPPTPELFKSVPTPPPAPGQESPEDGPAKAGRTGGGAGKPTPSLVQPKRKRPLIGGQPPLNPPAKP